MARTRSELAEQLMPPGKGRPDFGGTRINKGKPEPEPPARTPMGQEIGNTFEPDADMDYDMEGTRAKMAMSLPGKAQAKESSRKVAPVRASYTPNGPFPFVCENCAWLEDDYECERVAGPYDGKVKPNDTCRFFTPSAAKDEETPSEPSDAEDDGESEGTEPAPEPSGDSGVDGDDESGAEYPPGRRSD